MLGKKTPCKFGDTLHSTSIFFFVFARVRSGKFEVALVTLWPLLHLCPMVATPDDRSRHWSCHGEVSLVGVTRFGSSMHLETHESNIGITTYYLSIHDCAPWVIRSDR